MDKIAVWKPVEYEGMEYLDLMANIRGVLARSIVISVENHSAHQLNYTINCRYGFIVHDVNLTLDQRHVLYLTNDGQGNWQNEDGDPLPDLDGCIDVDISATPFTNTLPIRRKKWQVGQSEVFKMVYILVPDLKVSVMRQRYTCLAQNDQGATFRYENVDDDFKADITVDSDGLIVHYPGLFERVI